MMKTNPSFDPSLLGEKNLSEPVRAGVLELERIGWLHHAATIRFHNGFRLLAIHHNQRLYPDFLALCAVIANGTLGESFRIRRGTSFGAENAR